MNGLIDVFYFILNSILKFSAVCYFVTNQAFADEDGRLRTSTRPSVHVDSRPKFWPRPSISWTNSDDGPRLSFEGGRMDRIFTMDRPPHGRIRTPDQDNNFKVDERTNFLSWTVHLMDGIGRETKIIILRWTSARIFADGPSTLWTDSDDKNFHQMDGGGRVHE